MTRTLRLVSSTAAATAFALALGATYEVTPNGVGFGMSSAHAIIGRPLTPLSYAGVARRTTRRAVVAGAAMGAAVAAPVVVTPRPGCLQAVDAYGRIYWRCP